MNLRIWAQKDRLLLDGVPNHIHSFPEQYDMEERGMLLLAYTYNAVELINCIEVGLRVL